MAEINYTALAAKCERKAAEGIKPELEWIPVLGGVFHTPSWRGFNVCVERLDTHAIVHTDRRAPYREQFSLPDSAILFAEALLRDATKPLHREAYEALQIIQCAASLDMDDALHYVNGKFVLNCNDVFAWGCADCEEITVADLDAFKAACADSKHYNGALLFIARKRGIRPQGAFYSCIEADEWNLFDACGPARDADFGNPVATEKRREYAIQKEQERVACDRGVLDALRTENQRLAGEVSRSREVLDGMNADFHHLQANADTIANTLNQVRSENQRLRTALEKCADVLDIMLYDTEQIHRSTPMEARDEARAALSPEAPNG